MNASLALQKNASGYLIALRLNEMDLQANCEEARKVGKMKESQSAMTSDARDKNLSDTAIGHASQTSIAGHQTCRKLRIKPWNVYKVTAMNHHHRLILRLGNFIQLEL